MFKSQHTLRESLVRVKQSRPKEERNGVVYEVPCASCDHVYIGETGRGLKERVKEHRYAVRMGNMNNGILSCTSLELMTTMQIGKQLRSDCKNSITGRGRY